MENDPYLKYGFHFEDWDEFGQKQALRSLKRASELVGKSQNADVNQLLEEIIPILKQLIMLYDRLGIEEWYEESDYDRKINTK